MKSWITLRTCDSSVIHMSAIWGADICVLEAKMIAARWRVDWCLACLDIRFSCTASPWARGLTNTSGGRIATSVVGVMRPSSPVGGSFRSKRLEKGHYVS